MNKCVIDYGTVPLSSLRMVGGGENGRLTRQWGVCVCVCVCGGGGGVRSAVNWDRQLIVNREPEGR